jgi:hypothetical protein
MLERKTQLLRASFACAFNYREPELKSQIRPEIAYRRGLKMSTPVLGFAFGRMHPLKFAIRCQSRTLELLTCLRLLHDSELRGEGALHRGTICAEATYSRKKSLLIWTFCTAGLIHPQQLPKISSMKIRSREFRNAARRQVSHDHNEHCPLTLTVDLIYCWLDQVHGTNQAPRQFVWWDLVPSFNTDSPIIPSSIHEPRKSAAIREKNDENWPTHEIWTK